MSETSGDPRDRPATAPRHTTPLSRRGAMVRPTLLFVAMLGTAILAALLGLVGFVAGSIAVAVLLEAYRRAVRR